MERLSMGSEDEDEGMEMDMGVKEEDDDDYDEESLLQHSDHNNSNHHQHLQHHFDQIPIDGPYSPFVDGGVSQSMHTPPQQQTGSGGRRCRPKEEKERTKLRERHRRAITARILAGLRRHGNYNLRVRADINDVIAALAREAGWVVLPDGTTFPSRNQSPKAAGGVAGGDQIHTSPAPAAPPPPPAQGGMPDTVTVTAAQPLASIPSQQCHPTPVSTPRSLACGGGARQQYNRMKGVYVPPLTHYDLPGSGRLCHVAAVMGGDRAAERASDGSPLVGSSIDGENQIIDAPLIKLPERDFAGTPYVPVYVMLPLGAINMKCELVDPDGLSKQLRTLKAMNVDGVMIDCWWGIVEGHAPQQYNWIGYKQLFQMVRELKMKLQVVMSFHECGGNVGDDVCIPLPYWVTEIGRSNPDIYFTDREGRRNTECLTWGIDKERVLRGRTAVEVYFDYMRSFRVECDEFFEDGIISEIEIGLGPCGELRYPSYPAKHGWRYPGVGEFQCYDQYLLKSLRKAAEARGHSFWARGPDNAGTYNSTPHETGFFCDGGDYDSYYGRFFLGWYSKVLVDHGERVLSLANLAFEGTSIAAKVSGIHWWYKTASHAAELTAGFYNPSNRDGYAPIADMLKKHNAALNFTCVELRTLDQHEDFPEALADPEGLVWQVLNAAWDVSVPVASENALPCYDRDGYNKILANAKPYNDPDGRHLSAFTYLRLSPMLMERHNFLEFERFVKRMHGEAVLDLQV